MSESELRRQRVHKQHEPPEQQVRVDLVAGPHGTVFQPASLSIPAGTVCVWRNQTRQSQEVLPVGDGPPFKGGPLPPGATRLVLARRPDTLALRLASNPDAQLAIVVTDGA
jgi:plastocyanin